MDLPGIIRIIENAVRETSMVEWLAFLTALLYVFLAAYENIWCWLFALLSTAFYYVVCLQSKLYLETVLQVFYFAMGIYGWYQWKHKSKGQEERPVVSFSLRQNLPLIFLGAFISPIIGFVFFKFTNASQPWLDAAITTFSLIATWMVAKKILENWIFWIVIDALAILLYARKQLYLTSLLYFLYTAISVYGYFKWKKVLVKSKII